MRRQRNKFQTKEQGKSPEKDLSEMEMINNLHDTGFKVIVIKMFTNLRKEKWMNTENLNKETENVRKYQTEVIIELKYTAEGFNS